MQSIGVLGFFLYVPASRGPQSVQSFTRVALSAFAVSACVRSFQLSSTWAAVECLACALYLATTAVFYSSAKPDEMLPMVLPVEGKRRPYVVRMDQKRHQYVWVLITVMQATATLFVADVVGAWAVAVFVAAVAFWIPVNLTKTVVVAERSRFQYRLPLLLKTGWRFVSLMGAFAALDTISFAVYAALVGAAPVVLGMLELSKHATYLYTDSSLTVEAFVLPLLVWLDTTQTKNLTVWNWIALGSSVALLSYTVLRLLLCKKYYTEVLA